jgi:hypothetical protein
MTTVIFTTMIAFRFQWSYYFVNTFRGEDLAREFQFVVILVLGIILFLFQIKALLLLFIPQSMFSSVKIPFVASLLIPGMCKSEMMTKQAASYKISKMVTDAVAMHEEKMTGLPRREANNKESCADGPDETGFSGYGYALLNYHATVDDREEYGGMIWCFKGMWNGSIWNEEGVWIHARLYAMTFTQLFVGILFILIYFLFNHQLTKTFEELEQTEVASFPSPAPVAFYSYSTEDLAAIYGPLIQDAVEQYEWVSSASLSEAIWSNITQSAAVTFGASMLYGVSNEVLSSIIWNLDPDTLSEIASVINKDALTCVRTAVNSKQEDSFDGFRFLQEVTLSPTVYNETSMSEGDEFSILDLVPQKWEIFVATTAGSIFAVLAAFSLFVIWIPSAVATILQFRSGVLGSLHDKDFIRYR